jgi:hypothetical protein
MDWDFWNRWAHPEQYRDEDHEHEYDDATGEPYICPVDGCWFNGEIVTLDGCTCDVVRGAHKPPCPWAN